MICNPIVLITLLLFPWSVSTEETRKLFWEFEDFSRARHSSGCTCGPLADPCKPAPWTVYVHTLSQTCPATILNSNLVVTSHHCLLVEPTSRMHLAELFQYKYGKNYLGRVEDIKITSSSNRTSSSAKRFPLVKMWLNPSYALSSELKTFPEQDMVVIQVDVDFLSVGSGFMPICVPNYDENMNERVELRSKVLGYFSLSSVPGRIMGAIYKKDECTEDTLLQSDATVCVRFTGEGEVSPGEQLIVESGKASFLAGVAVNPAFAAADVSGKFASLGLRHAYFSFINSLIKYVEYFSAKARSKWCLTPRFNWAATHPPVDANATKMYELVEALTKTAQSSASSSLTNAIIRPWETTNESMLRRSEILDCICGNRFVPKFRIVGGAPAQDREFGWMASLTLFQSGNKEAGGSICGGSVINDRMIITAAHCVVVDEWVKSGNSKVSISPRDVDILLNTNKREGDSKAVEMEVISVLFHPDYLVGRAAAPRQYFDKDVALLVLKEPLKFEPGIGVGLRPICLPKRGKYLDVVGRQGTVVGWGLTNPDSDESVAQDLQKITLPIQELTMCTQILRFKVTNNFLCAGTLNKFKDAARGDSGGPLQIEESKTHRWTQVGIVSFEAEGRKDGQKLTAALYTDLQKVMDFIDYHSNRVHARWCKSGGPFDDQQ